MFDRYPDDTENPFEGLTMNDTVHPNVDISKSDPDPALILWVFGSLVIAIVMFILIFVIGGSSAWAEDIQKPRAINAIIGEAEGEPYKGKLAVACAIRNRGTLKGVYGETSSRVVQHKYSTKVFVDSVRAWEESFHPENCRFIDGADHWEGTSFKTPSWAKNMVITATIGNQKFYKVKNGGRNQ